MFESILPKRLAEFFGKTQLPEPALASVAEKVGEHISLVTQSNGWVGQILAAKEADPKNTEYVDSLWDLKADEGNELVAEKAERYQKLREQAEVLLKELRQIAVENFIEPPISEEEATKLRAKVNEAAPAIATSRAAVQAMLLMPEGMLTSLGVELPEGGLTSLLPTPNSLKTGKGRKATAGTRGPYATQVGDILFDGKSTMTADGKCSFLLAAEVLSKKFNAERFDGNKVTERELEAALFEHLGVEFRSIAGKDLADTTEFTFTKDIEVQVPNDDSTKREPQIVKVTIRSKKSVKAEQEKANEAKNEDKPVQPNSESKPVPVNVPAKKTTAPAKK